MSDQLESQAMSFIYRITQHSFDGTIHPELYEADVDVIRQLLAERRIDKAILNAKTDKTTPMRIKLVDASSRSRYTSRAQKPTQGEQK